MLLGFRPQSLLQQLLQDCLSKVGTDSAQQTMKANKYNDTKATAFLFTCCAKSMVQGSFRRDIIFLIAGSSITITNHTILSNNSAVTHGGAISCSGCQALTMQVGSSAHSNQAENLGGACYCVGCNTFHFHLHNVNVSTNRYKQRDSLLMRSNSVVSCPPRA